MQEKEEGACPVYQLSLYAGCFCFHCCQVLEGYLLQLHRTHNYYHCCCLLHDDVQVWMKHCDVVLVMELLPV
jgi:hypothetical protein